MRTEARRLAALLAAGLALVAGPAAAQIEVDAATQIHSIKIRQVKGPGIPEPEIRGVITQRAPGTGEALQHAVAWLPFVPEPQPKLFSPLELQRDVVRLRRLFSDDGFPRAQVGYQVQKDEKRNRVDITFVIDQGRPLIVRSIEFAGADSVTTLTIPPSEQRDWDKFERSTRKLEGETVRWAAVAQIERDARSWWQDRGYPHARVAMSARIDTAVAEARILARIQPGVFARFSDIGVEGVRTIKPDVVSREVPIHPGDPYSARRLTEGQLSVQSLEIVRLALVDAPGEPGGDSTVAVRARVTEAEPHMVSGALGYVSDAGVSAEASWAHRNINSRAVSLTVQGVAQTGWLALVDNPDIRYRASVTLRQPYFVERRLSLMLTPYVEKRDDAQDLSLQYGADLTPLYQFSPLRSIALKYGISWKDIYEYRFGDFAAGDIDLLTLLQRKAQALLDTLGTGLWKSQWTLSATVGTLDNPAAPHRGVLFRPAFSVTAPAGFNSTQYSRLDASLFTYTPVTHRTTLAIRLTGGALVPFGKSLPGPGDDPSVKYLQLRDVAFTGGGTFDVRGWANRLLGPKAPDIRVETNNGDTTLVSNGYVPSGGLDRVSGSIELQIPLSSLGTNMAADIFLDAGRVWTADPRFRHGFDIEEQERMFYSTGAELALRTPVGPIRFGVGYKLNPSTEDVVDSTDLVRALQSGQPLDQLPRHENWRWQLHLAIGSAF
jgi:outer membrane protein insertion porin family